jgi:death-on-curing family protein
LEKALASKGCTSWIRAECAQVREAGFYRDFGSVVESLINPSYEKIYMISEYILSREEIRSINEQYGGSLRMDAEIETALEAGKGKTIFKKVAYLLRAILVGHPFTDGNKRTALMVTLAMLEKCQIDMDEGKKENLVSEIRKIASENERDISRIERLVRYAVTGD